MGLFARLRSNTKTVAVTGWFWGTPISGSLHVIYITPFYIVVGYPLRTGYSLRRRRVSWRPGNDAGYLESAFCYILRKLICGTGTCSWSENASHVCQLHLGYGYSHFELGIMIGYTQERKLGNGITERIVDWRSIFQLSGSFSEVFLFLGANPLIPKIFGMRHQLYLFLLVDYCSKKTW